MNGAYTGDNAIGKLMADFRTSDPKTMHYEALAKTSEYFKTDEKGVAKMCREMEKIGDERWAEGHAEGRSEYAEELAKLRKVLIAAGRDDDIMRAIDDPAYAETLFEEFDI